MGRGTSKVGGGSGGGQDNSYAYTRNMSREDAHEEIVDKLLAGDNPVLLSKNGHFAVANGWDEADYAIKNYGWQYDPDPASVSSELGERARNIQAAFPGRTSIGSVDTSRSINISADDSAADLNRALGNAGLARMPGNNAGTPYRSSTSSDRLVDLVGADGRIYTGTWDTYSDGSINIHSIKLRSQKAGARSK